MKFVKQEQIAEVLERKSGERRKLMTWVNVFKRKAVLLRKSPSQEKRKERSFPCLLLLQDFLTFKSLHSSSVEDHYRLLNERGANNWWESGWESRGSHDITKRLWDDITNLFLTLIQWSRSMRDSGWDSGKEERERKWKWEGKRLKRDRREWRKKESASRMKGVTTKSWGRHTKRGQIYVSKLPEKRQEETDNAKNHKNAL